MADAYLDADIEGLSGRLSKKTNAAYARNKKTGKCYRYEYNVNTKHTNTEKQQAVKATFKSKSLAAATWWNNNKPSDTNKEGTALYQALMKKYDAQNKYGNPYCYLRSLVADDLTITIGTTTTSNNGNAGDADLQG